MATPRMRYSPALNDLLFCTTAAQFLEKMGNREQLVTLLVLKDIESVAPALPILEREKLCDRLIESSVVPYISAFNVRNVFLNLPNPDIFGQRRSVSVRNYELLKEITVDDINVISILQMIEYGLFPHLESLTIFASGRIEFGTLSALSTAEGHTRAELENHPMNKLCSLTLHNMSDEVLELPNLGLGILPLRELMLVGYAVEFKTRLPGKLTLEQCYVEGSQGLPGCEEMSLTNVRWDTMSMPSRSLYVERGVLNVQPPPTLERLQLVDSKVDLNDLSLNLLPKLSFARFDNIDTGNMLIILDSPERNLKELVISTEKEQFSRLPDTVVNMHFAKSMFMLPLSIRRLNLHQLGIELCDILPVLPGNLEFLELTDCSFEESAVITERQFPNTLKTLHFFKCKSRNRITIAPPPTLTELVIIGKFPELQDENETWMGRRASFRWLHSLTNTLMMDLREFRLFCLDKLNKSIFQDFEECIIDATRAWKWLEPGECQKYVDILLEYPFHIPVTDSKEISRLIIERGNGGMLMNIANNTYTVDQLRALIAGPETDIEKTSDKLSRFVRNLRTAPGN